jgi:hypothetical protein
MKTYTIPEFEITVQVMTNNGKPAGTIESELKKHFIGDGPSNDPELLAVVDALESLILAHACAGLDISSPAYVEGLRTSLEAIANHA